MNKKYLYSRPSFLVCSPSWLYLVNCAVWNVQHCTQNRKLNIQKRGNQKDITQNTMSHIGFDKKCTCNLNVYIFYFVFCARHFPWWLLWQKCTKNNYFIQVKPLFSVVDFSNTVTFCRNARINVILTSVTIIKQIFHQTLKHLIIDRSYSLGSSDVITNVNTMTPINPLFFSENKRRIHGCLKWKYKRNALITCLLRIIRNVN